MIHDDQFVPSVRRTSVRRRTARAVGVSPKVLPGGSPPYMRGKPPRTGYGLSCGWFAASLLDWFSTFPGLDFQTGLLQVQDVPRWPRWPQDPPKNSQNEAKKASQTRPGQSKTRKRTKKTIVEKTCSRRGETLIFKVSTCSKSTKTRF